MNLHPQTFFSADELTRTALPAASALLPSLSKYNHHATRRTYDCNVCFSIHVEVGLVGLNKEFATAGTGRKNVRR